MSRYYQTGKWHQRQTALNFANFPSFLENKLIINQADNIPSKHDYTFGTQTNITRQLFKQIHVQHASLAHYIRQALILICADGS